MIIVGFIVLLILLAAMTITILILPSPYEIHRKNMERINREAVETIERVTKEHMQRFEKEVR